MLARLLNNFCPLVQNLDLLLVGLLHLIQFQLMALLLVLQVILEVLTLYNMVTALIKLAAQDLVLAHFVLNGLFVHRDLLGHLGLLINQVGDQLHQLYLFFILH